MAGGRRHTVMGAPSSRRAGSAGGARPGATATGPASHQTHSRTRGSGPASGAGSGGEAGFSPRRSGFDVLILVVGGRPAARGGCEGRSRRADARRSLVRRMVRMGETRRSAGECLSRRGSGRLRRAVERQGRRRCGADRRRRDGFSPAGCRRRSPDILRMVCAGQHRPEPGPGACTPFRHGGPTCARPGRRRQRRPLGRVGGGRDQVASGRRENCHPPRRRLGGHRGALRSNDLR
jgi:hypothetical protein